MSNVDTTYSYDRFAARHYDLQRFAGPRVGEMVPPFVAQDFQGNPVSLADFGSQTIVVETGSATCNMYASNQKEMEALRRRHPDVLFILLYVREAHPGRNIPQPRDEVGKRINAMRLAQTQSENRLILVDDLEGTAHRQLGALPNSIHVIDGNGRLVYRKDWNVAREVGSVLTEMAGPVAISPRNDRTTTLQLLRRRPHLSVLWRAGSDAVLDVIAAIPSLARSHLRTDKQSVESK